MLVGDVDAVVGQRPGVGDALVPERVVSAGEHRRRRQSGEVRGPTHRRKRVAGVYRVAQVPIPEPSEVRSGEKRPVGVLLDALRLQRRVDHRIQQGLLNDRYRERIAGVERRRRGEIAAGAGSRDADPIRIGTDRRSVLGDPLEGAHGVRERCGKRVLRCEAIVDRDDQTTGPGGEFATDVVGGIERPEDPAPAVVEDDRGRRRVGSVAVDPDRNRARRARDFDVEDVLDARTAAAEEVVLERSGRVDRQRVPRRNAAGFERRDDVRRPRIEFGSTLLVASHLVRTHEEKRESSPGPTTGMDEFGADETTARHLDDADPLSSYRGRFEIPDDVYLDGNSLGPASDEAVAALEHVVEEWRTLGVRGWTDGDPPWFRYGERLGDRLAPFVGAREDEVVVANSTTVNIHTLVGTFLDRADGDRIVVDELDFPTDQYAIRAQLRRRGLDPDDHLVVVESRDGRTVDEERVIDALDDEVGLLFFPSVLYRSGQLFDLERLARAAHDHDALVGFDLAHSVGVVPHELSAIGADFAVWCHYKYCNAGPGAIAGLYVNERHFGATPALPGWWGHEKETQFELNPEYTPASTAGAWQIGTIPVFAAAPLDGALSIHEAAGIEAIRRKSIDLTEYLIALADERLERFGVEVGTPRDPGRRGGHVALEHERAYEIGAALRERGAIVDVRPPNVIRVCPAPLYTRFEDVRRFVDELVSVFETVSLADVDRSSDVT